MCVCTLPPLPALCCVFFPARLPARLPARFPASQVSLGYNLARVKEACGSLKAAEAEYRELLKQFPQYGDCCMRLACIARARGDTKASVCRTALITAAHV